MASLPWALVVCAGATDDAINAAREAFHRHLAATQKSQQHVQDTSEEDLSQADERELDAEFAGQSRISLFCLRCFDAVCWAAGRASGL